MLQKKPDFFVIGSGKTYSIEYFVKKCFEYVGLNYKKYVVIDKKLFRPSNTTSLKANIKKAKKIINFNIKTNINQLIKIMMDNDLKLQKEVMKIRNSIIICTYNEVGNIKLAIRDIQNNIPNSEIILVDDNSTDGTQKEISEIGVSHNIKIIIRKKINGLASAFQRGLIETEGEYIGWIDTNMTYLTSKFSEMSKLLDEGNDIVILSRYVKDGMMKGQI